MPKRKIIKRDITKEQFFALLNVASQPRPNESDEALLETSVVPQDDGCNETDIHSDMIERTSD